MTLNLSIDIPPEAVQALQSCAASQGEDLATLAGQVLVQYATTMSQTPTAPANSNQMNGHGSERIDSESRSQRAQALLNQSRTRQAIVPLPDDPPGISSRWPEGESVEEFLQTIRDLDEASVPRVFP